jgi:hypothetical protein
MSHDVDTIGDAKIQTRPKDAETVKITLEFNRNTGELLKVLDKNGDSLSALDKLGKPLSTPKSFSSWPMHDTIIGVQPPHTHGPQERSCCPGGKPHYYVNGIKVCPT